MAFSSSVNYQPAKPAGGNNGFAATQQGQGMPTPMGSPSGFSGSMGSSLSNPMGGNFRSSQQMSPLMQQLMQRAQSGTGGTAPGTGPGPMASFPNLMSYFNRGNTGITGGMGLPKMPQFPSGMPDSPYKNDWSPRNPDGSIASGDIKAIPGSPQPPQELPQFKFDPSQFDPSKMYKFNI